jgi:diguanylate cyclase (GGDEF)-like protein
MEDTTASPKIVGDVRADYAVAPARRLWALSVTFALVLATAFAFPVAAIAGPDWRFLLSAATGCWIAADFLTAALLLSRYFSTGRFEFVTVATAYAISGTLAFAFMASTPALAGFAPTQGDLQVPPALWVSRSFMFFACLVAGRAVAAYIPRLSLQRVSRPAIVWGVGAVVLLITAAVVFPIVVFRNQIPILISQGHFTDEHVRAVLTIAFACACACFFMLSGTRGVGGSLRMWLAVALASLMLENILKSVSPMRLSIGWDVAVLEDIAASSFMFFVLLSDLVKRYCELAFQAGRDPLTGLRNRRTFESDATVALEESAQCSDPASVLVVDIDHFKPFNDRYGHAHGDDALRRVAKTIEGSVRPCDVVARVGGEEFVVLLPGADASAAFTAAERIRAGVEASRIEHGGSITGRLTVSIGVTTIARAERDAASRLFAAADAALYEAKRIGRNVVVCSDRSNVALRSVIPLNSRR